MIDLTQTFGGLPTRNFQQGQFEEYENLTGNTIKETRLIANKNALDDPWKKQKIDQISLLLQASLHAHQKVALSMNVPADRLDAIVDLLPSLHAPTVNHLYDKDWLAVETVVDSSRVRDLIPELRAAGAEGILEYELRKIV